jgi:predicted transcriptional regulator
VRTDTATRRHQALELIAEGQPPHAVAERLGVSLRSIRRYLASPDARATLQRLRDERLAQLAGRALAEAAPALAILRQIAEDPDAPPQARVSAASKLLDVATRLYEAVDLAERVRQLEDVVEPAGGGRYGAP